jgi:class 3 adenylate cyclase
VSNDAPIRDHKAWLGYVQQDGLVVSPTALVDAQVVLDRNTLPMQERFLPFTKEVTDDNDNALIAIADFPAFARNFLGWPDDCLHGLDATRPLPDTLSVALPDYGETLMPTFAFKDPRPKDPAQPWLLLVQSIPLATDLDARVATDERGWSASPTQRMERLLRETKVPIGVLFNGTQIRLLYAPHGENSGNITFTVRHMTEMAGRPILAALHMLLRESCSGATPSEARLPALLRRSREYQSTVSTTLAQQVLDSLYELLRGFQAADERAKGELLRAVLAKNPDDVYAGLLNVLMRMVFLLFAEDRAIVPTDPKSKQPTELYVRHYSVHGLFERLRADAEHYPDTMDQRYGAWAQLLALFRAVHDGCKHPQMQMPARHGHLFDPDRFKFLEGRTLAEPRLPLVSDGTIYRVLHKLFILDGERLSYRTLDVQEIGSVYQTIMGFAIEVSGGQSIALKGKRKNGSVPASPVVNLEILLAVKSAERTKWLKENADTELNGEAEKKLKAAVSVDDLLAAMEKRIDRGATPGPVPKGGLVLQPTDERRRSGSHYTPRSFTEPIVRKTLEPILKRLGEYPTPAQILELKICDIAVGSAAFLVETCRQLGDALVKAWRHHGGRPPLPDDEAEELLAMRTVAQRCLYGVDRNPMAVDLAKLSLWLVTLAKDHPFTFVDHAIRCGDSLVGLTRRQIETFTWKTEFTTGQLWEQEVRKRTAGALRERQNLLGLGDDYGTPQLKRERLEKADELLELVRFIGDAAVAAFFGADKDKAREAKRAELAERISDYLNKGDFKQRPTDEVNALRSGEFPVTPFHNEIEFPEVFDRENPGFDAIVGNPPYIGGTMISTANGDAYKEWLYTSFAESGNRMDLVAYFFRRAFNLLRQDGSVGLIATNTIAQGDTRKGGLRYICKNGGVIYDTERRIKWPGVAAVTVSSIHIYRGKWSGECHLDGEPVGQITAFLFKHGGHDDPLELSANAGKSFEGFKIAGQGFVFDDHDEEASPLSEMERLLTNPRNRERIFPYIGGEEVNDSPTHAFHRYVIDFDDLDEAEAARWPELLEIVRAKVKPYRDTVNRDAHRKRWWLYGERRPGLRAALLGRSRVLVCSLHQQFWLLAFLQSKLIFSHGLGTFAFENFAALSLLQSRVHEVWARFFASSLEDRLRYTPSDCFETFPFPAGFETSVALEAAGQEYYEFRAALMVRNDEGLTKTYNRFHDPEESSPDIIKLRELHAKMDAAVLAAYGWTDLPTTCDFILDYEDEESAEESSGRKRKKPWRFRWPDEVRDEVLARLLILNAERAKEEELAGQTAAAQKPKAKKAAAKTPKAGKAQLALGIATPAAAERKLPTDWRLPASQPLLYTTNLVLTLLSEAGGSLAWPRLLDAFVLATNPKLTQRLAPAELAAQAKAWSARWNETVPDGLLLPSLNQLGASNLTVTEGNDGPVFHLLDGPRLSLSEDVRFDAWLALRVAATLMPDAVQVPERAKWTKEAKKLVPA